MLWCCNKYFYLKQKSQVFALKATSWGCEFNSKIPYLCQAPKKWLRFVCTSHFDIDFLFINVNRFMLNHSRAFEMGSTVVYFRPLWLSIPLRSWRVNSWDGPVCRMQRGQKLLNNGLHSRALARREAKKGARSFPPHPGGGMPHCCCRARGPAAADIAVLHSATAVWMI